MSKVNMQPYKGARDFYPEDMRLRKWMFSKWRRVAERYGYEEYDAPLLERTELYLMKGNEEIVQEQSFTFKDRGDRSVTLRTEMTPSVSRMVAARRQEIVYPARWYSIPNCWRYERMQRGRGREFFQLNVDIFGVESRVAELEIIQIVDDLFQAFKAKRSTYTIKLNSRVLVNTMLANLHLTDNQAGAAIRLIDRIAKIDAQAFAEQLDSITGSKDVSKAIVDLLKVKKIAELPFRLRESENAKVVQSIIDTCAVKGVHNVEFDITLMRGFDYYTDIVFEVFDTNPENNRSMFGGGRYDGLIGEFGAEPVPTVGFGMGDITFRDFLQTHKLIPKLKPTVDLTLLIRSPEAMSHAQKAVQELREMGVNTAIDYSGRKIDKQLKAAVKSGVRYVLFVGGDEGDDERFVIKNLKNGDEQKHSLPRIVSMVKDSRKT